MLAFTFFSLSSSPSFSSLTKRDGGGRAGRSAKPSAVLPIQMRGIKSFKTTGVIYAAVPYRPSIDHRSVRRHLAAYKMLIKVLREQLDTMAR